MDSHRSRVATASALIRGSLLMGSVALVVIALGTGLGSPTVAGAPVPADMSSSAVASVSPATSNCWVTGDLVGEGNPADLAAALCGQK